MNIIRSLLLISALVVGTAYAHQDRILTILPDGSIPEIPAHLGPVFLEISGLGTAAPTVRFRSRTHRTNLPACATRLINTRQLKDVFITGSWYHDESRLPYYVSVKFYDPGYVKSRPYNSSFNVLFNLRTAQIIKIQRFVATPSGDGGQFQEVDLPKGCALSWHAA